MIPLNPELVDVKPVTSVVLTPGSHTTSVAKAGEANRMPIEQEEVAHG
jgi:hypothetical protein